MAGRVSAFAKRVKQGVGQRGVLNLHNLASFVTEKQPFCSMGTTILHVCVVHDQPRIFTHLVRHFGTQMHLRNSWWQTPLATAATQGRAAAEACASADRASRTGFETADETRQRLAQRGVARVSAAAASPTHIRGSAFADGR